MDPEAIEILHTAFVSSRDHRITEFNVRWASVLDWSPKIKCFPLGNSSLGGNRYRANRNAVSEITRLLVDNIDSNRHIPDQELKAFWRCFAQVVGSCSAYNDAVKFIFWLSQLPYIDMDPDTIKPVFCDLLEKNRNLVFIGVITCLPDFIRVWAAEITRLTEKLEVPTNNKYSALAIDNCIANILSGFQYCMTSISSENPYLFHQYRLAVERVLFLDVTNNDFGARELKGRGANGSVFKVKCRNKTFAIKSVHFFNEMTKEEMRATMNAHYINEFINLLFYPHPNIVKFFHCFMNHKAIVPKGCTEYSTVSLDFVFEFCDKGSLKDFIGAQKGHFESNRSLASAAYAILSPLVYLHGYNIVHRDIKPANFLVTASFEIKLADLGESIHELHEKNAARCSSTCTPSYTAPELSKEGSVQSADYSLSKADVWGVGCVLYELVLGKNPFEEEAARHNPPPRLKNHKFIVDTLTAMVAPEWHQRISAADALGHFYVFNFMQLNDVPPSVDDRNAMFALAAIQSGVFAHPRKVTLAYLTESLRRLLATPAISVLLSQIVRAVDHGHEISIEIITEALKKTAPYISNLKESELFHVYLTILLPFRERLYALDRATFCDFLWAEGLLQLCTNQLLGMPTVTEGQCILDIFRSYLEHLDNNKEVNPENLQSYLVDSGDNIALKFLHLLQSYLRVLLCGSYDSVLEKHRNFSTGETTPFYAALQAIPLSHFEILCMLSRLVSELRSTQRQQQELERFITDPMVNTLISHHSTIPKVCIADADAKNEFESYLHVPSVVLCKNFKNGKVCKAQCGRSRVKCTKCQDRFLVVLRDPRSWNEFISSRIMAHCYKCEDNVRAEFFLICSNCREAGSIRFHEIRRQLCERGCANAVIDITMTSQDRETIRRASMALVNLALNYNNELLIFKSGILAKLLSQLSDRKDKELTILASKILVHLTTIERIRKYVSEGGGIAASLDMLASVDEDYKLQGAKLVTNLAISGSNRKAMHNRGFVADLRKMSKRVMESPS